MGSFLHPPPNNAPIVIYEDGGGIVEEYKAAAWRYGLEHRRIEIRGSCRSACTLALGVPNVCVGYGAVVKFHEAYEQKTGIVRHDITKEMLSLTPAKVRQAVEPNISINYNKGSILYYDQLVNLGIPSCDKPDNKKQETPVLIKTINKIKRNPTKKFNGPLDAIMSLF